MNTPSPLTEAEYVNLATFRKNGEKVCTPVWAARWNEALYIFTQLNTGKVKRIRRSPMVQMAECTAGGKIKGAWREARATIVEDPEEKENAYRVLRDKYGWKMKTLDLFSGLTGKSKTRAIIRIDF